MPGKKKPNKKEEFNKLDEFYLGIIRRIVHTFYQNNKTFSLKKTTKQAKRGNKVPILNNYLKYFFTEEARFWIQETTKISIIHERPDLVS